MSCWDCGLHKAGGITLLGACKWWKEPRDIPPDVVDKGCNHWRSKEAQEVIAKFNGELIK